mgnify:CR=1 FL=1
MYEKDKDGVLACASMYEEYEAFCTNQHIKPSAPPVFGKYIYQVNPFRCSSLCPSLFHLPSRTNPRKSQPTANTLPLNDTTLRTKRNAPRAQITVYPEYEVRGEKEKGRIAME